MLYLRSESFPHPAPGGAGRSMPDGGKRLSSFTMAGRGALPHRGRAGFHQREGNQGVYLERIGGAMMDYRENAGYVITDSCHVGDSEFVLGVHLTAPQQFVTWKCTGRTDYYWGHYFSDLFSAQKDLVARAQEEVQCMEEQRQNSLVPETPPYSPWGEIQECEKLCPGAYSVSTPGHGGIMVSRELAEKVFRKEAMDCGFTAGAYLCFEEDCDEPVALRELIDTGMYQTPVNERFAPGAYEALIIDSLQTFHPTYWQAREKALAKENRQPKKKDRGDDR